MVIGAHADDNEFCFGATMLKYHETFGYDIVYVQSTNNMSGGWNECIRGPRAGLSPLPPWITQKKTTSNSEECLQHTVPWYHEIHQRKTEAANVARDCFHTVPIHLDYAQRHYTDRHLNKVDLRYGVPAPDAYDPAVPTIMSAYEYPEPVERVKRLILDKNPEVILTHAPVDYTFEHGGTTLLVRNAFYQAQLDGYDGSLLCAVSPIKELGDFFDRWDAYIDTTGFMEKKKQAIGKHACQVADPERLDLWDPVVGQMCGGLKSAEPFTVVQLSETRGGRLTEEFLKTHRYCMENWAKLFFSPESKGLLDQFFDDYREQNGMVRKPRTASTL